MAFDHTKSLQSKLGKLTKKQLTQLLVQASVALNDSSVCGAPSTVPKSSDARDGAGCARCLTLEIHNQDLCDAQDDMESSRAGYCDLFYDAPIGYCRLDEAGVVTHANMAAWRMVGRSQALAGLDFALLMANQDQILFKRLLRSHAWGDAARVVECSNFGFQVEPLRVDLVVRREAHANQHATGFKVMLIDVTRRRAVEHDLRMLSEASHILGASLDYHETLPTVLRFITTARTPYCFVDLADGRDASCRLCAHQDEATDVSSPRELIDAWFPPGGPGSPQKQVAESGKPLISQAFASGTAGSSLSCDGLPCAILPLIANQRVLGSLTLILGREEVPYDGAEMHTTLALAERIAMAVSRGQAHREAHQAIRERQVVLGTVAHDLKNVITAVALRSELLTQMDNTRASSSGRAILRLTGRMDRMLEDLMDVASIDRGQLSLRPREYGAQDLLEEAAESSRSVAQAKGISLHVEPGENYLVFCDVDRCLQVLGNFISNAVKFSPPNSRVALVQRQQDRLNALFCVTDRGPGLSAEEQPMVFNSFWRVRDQSAKGRGLGLTICRGIVEGSGGKIGVDSRVNEGSTFYFTLPIAEVSTSERRAEHHQKILVVDDDDDVRTATCEILERAGFEVCEANNGREALDMLLHDCNPSLVLLDLNMPILDGWKFLNECSQMESMNCPEVVVFSGEKTIQEQVLARGASFLLKPISSHSLVSSIREQIEKKSSQT